MTTNPKIKDTTKDTTKDDATEDTGEPRSAAEKSLIADPAETAVNPFPNYDLMSLDQLRTLAAERGVSINPDVEKAHLVTALRAADTHTR